MTARVRRAVVTGAQGFLGRRLVRELTEAGMLVTGLARHGAPDSPCIAMGDGPWQAQDLARIIEETEPDVVYHLAGRAVGSAPQLQAANVDLARSVMDALVLAQARPLLVCCGSAAEYGGGVTDGEPTAETAACAPLTFYGASKLAQTHATLAFAQITGKPVLIARIFNPIGPSMPAHLALADFAQQIAADGPSGKVLRTGNLDVARDFIDVGLVARALHRLALHPAAAGVVNICSGRPMQLAQLVAMLIAASGRQVRLERDPMRVRPGELRAIFGDPGLLSRLTGILPETDYPAVTELIWQDAAAYAAGRPGCMA